MTETGDDERILPGAIVKKIVTGADGALEPLSAETQQFKPHGQKQVSILPYTSLANFHLWPQNPVPLGVIERGRIMRAQRVWLRVEHDYSAERVHLALKRALGLYLPDFRKQAIEQKVRFQGFTDLVRSELRHLGSFIWEWFCLAFQI